MDILTKCTAAAFISLEEEGDWFRVDSVDTEQGIVYLSNDETGEELEFTMDQLAEKDEIKFYKIVEIT